MISIPAKKNRFNNDCSVELVSDRFLHAGATSDRPLHPHHLLRGFHLPTWGVQAETSNKRFSWEFSYSVFSLLLFSSLSVIV